MEFWYKFLTYLFYPISPIYLYWRRLKKKEHPVRYREKLSKISEPRGDGFLIWYHVASVGEAMSILPLIENFEKNEKVKKILITTITLSSGEILKKRYSKNSKVIHQYLPLDICSLVKKFIDHWKPNLAIFIDSEIWPNLILETKKKNIPLLLINARITKKTFSRWMFSKKFAKKIFEKFDMCIVANNETENYLKILGSKNIKNYGNLKFSKTKNLLNKELDQNLLSRIKNRKIWCAASTHPLEEIFCAQVHLQLKKTYQNILTIIIPRHINRTESIYHELSKLKLNVAFYTKPEQITNDTDILIVNTYGEALKFYNIARSVFVGKSLISSLKKVGGQNPIEPARLGCKIYHGPFVSNFEDVYRLLRTLNVAEEIKETSELTKCFVDEFEKNKLKDAEIIETIEKYGQNTLNNVIKEINIYINSK